MTFGCDRTFRSNETQNLSGSSSCVGIEQQLQLRTLDYFMQTGDVLSHEVDSRGV